MNSLDLQIILFLNWGSHGIGQYINAPNHRDKTHNTFGLKDKNYYMCLVPVLPTLSIQNGMFQALIWNRSVGKKGLKLFIYREYSTTQYK